MPDNIFLYLTLFIPIILIPLVMKLIIAPIILLRLKKKYVKDITSTIKEGWVDDKDLEAIEYLKKNAWKGLSTPFVISYNINFLQAQIRTLFMDITQIYNNNSQDEINLKFSIQKILEASYLIFEDLHRDLKKMKVYRFLEKLTINHFLRVTKLNKSIKVVTQNKVIQILKKYRISTKLLRLILTPILGFPIIIYQLIFSLLYSTLFEGYLRFIYGMILIKVGYYTIYLYSDRNSSLHNRLKFSHKDIIKRGEIIEKRHTKFKNRYDYSPYLENAMKVLNDELNKENIMPNKDITIKGDAFSRIIKRVTNTLKNTIDSELTSEPSNKFNLKPIIRISENIGKVYFTNSTQPLYQMRVKESIEFGFFFTTVLLKNIYTIPASKAFLDKIPLKLVIDISDFIEDKNIKKHIPTLKKGSKIFKNIKSYYWASKVIVKRSNPVVFVASMVTPILFQQVDDSVKEYVYNMTGKLLIDSYESTVLKSKNCRITEIFQ